MAVDVVARLDQLGLERREARAARRAEAEANADPRESVARVAAAVDRERQGIKVLLVQARGGETTTTTDGARALAMASKRIMELESELSSCSYFLPAYDARSLLAAVTATKREVAEARRALTPRQPFRFKYLEAIRNGETVLDMSEEESGPVLDVVNGGAERARTAGIYDREGEEVCVSETELGGGEFALSNLRDCVVYLLGPMASLYVYKVERCRIFAGPASGSVHVEEATASCFHLASHQIRIHTATSTDFYLRVRSNPIIEHSAGVRFAPYALHYDRLEENLATTGLADADLAAAGAGDDKWKRVEDFGWVRKTKSPNWDVMPEEKRGETVIAPGNNAPTTKKSTEGGVAHGLAPETEPAVSIAPDTGDDDESEDEM